MSRLNEVTCWLFALLVTSALIMWAAYAAGCTLRVDPTVDPPQINIGCVVVDLGSSQVFQCPDAGRDAK